MFAKPDRLFSGEEPDACQSDDQPYEDSVYNMTEQMRYGHFLTRVPELFERVVFGYGDHECKSECDPVSKPDHSSERDCPCKRGRREETYQRDIDERDDNSDYEMSCETGSE